ncbi:MAG TPA: substrate-binding domain-containing protein [Solirubrobacteraceae bacterium]|jgi:hypothetical protein
MSIYTRVKRLALGAACLGGGLLGIGTALVPATAAAGTLSCANITGSGSSLQKVAQINVFTTSFASTSCAKAPTITYTSTGSGAGLKEFGNGTEVLAPAESGNKTSLDGYVGTDDAPTPAQTNEAGKAAGGGNQRELTIPVAEAPVAVLLHPPSACTITGTPNISNGVLDELWQDKFASWQAFLTAAGISATGTCTEPVTLVVRQDNSGTSYVFKSYLNQFDSAVWQPYANDFTTWPDLITHAATKGGSGEVAEVKAKEGSVGYAATADAHAGAFGVYPNASKGYFWAEVQNNGTAALGATYADPANGSNGNCPTAVTPAGTPTAPGDWFGVLASNPKISTAAGFVIGQYSLCGLTYDLAWKDYSLIGSYGSAPAPVEVGNAASDFLTYVTSQGQSALATAGQYYSALPMPVQKVAQETATEVNNPSSGGGNGGGNNGGGGGGTGGGGTTSPPTTTTPGSTTPTATPITTTKTPTAVKPLTKAQKLANALKACKKKSKKQRASCEKQAKKKYGATKSHKKSKKH